MRLLPLALRACARRARAGARAARSRAQFVDGLAAQLERLRHVGEVLRVAGEQQAAGFISGSKRASTCACVGLSK